VNKIFIGIILILLILLGVGSWFLKHEIEKNSSQKVELSSATDSIKALSSQLALATSVAQIQDSVVTTNITDKQKSNTVKEKILRKVHVTEHKAQKKEITSAVANSVYLNSMWAAYCEAKPSDSACSSRQSSSGLSN